MAENRRKFRVKDEDGNTKKVANKEKALDSELDSCKHSMQTMEEDYMRKTALLDQKIEDLGPMAIDTL